MEALATRPRRRCSRTCCRPRALGEFRVRPDATRPGTAPHSPTRRGRRAGARPREAAARAPSVPRLLERADALIARHPDAAVRDGRRARRLPAAAARHPRDARQVPARRLRPLARRADRRDRPAPRLPRDVERQPPAPQAPGEGVRAARACTSPICTSGCSRIQQQRVLYQRFVTTGVRRRTCPAGITDVWTEYQARRGRPDRARRAARRSRARPTPCCRSRSTMLRRPARRRSPPTPRCSQNLQDRTAVHGPAARRRTSPRCSRTSPVATCRRSRWAPSSSSPGGRACSSGCSPRTPRCSARTPPCSTGSSRTSGSSTRRMRGRTRSGSPGSSPDAWRLGARRLGRGGGGAAAAAAGQGRRPRRAAPRGPAPDQAARAGLARVALRGARRSATVAFDTVFVVDAGALSFAEGLGAVRRAKQVVAFGDPVTQTPMPLRHRDPGDRARAGDAEAPRRAARGLASSPGIADLVPTRRADDAATGRAARTSPSS